MTAPGLLTPPGGAEPATDDLPALVADIERVRDLLDAYARGEAAGSRAARPHAAPVRRLAELFGLSPFETDVLLFAAAVELDGAVAGLCSRVQGGGRPGGDPRPTFGLALAVLPEGHWDAVSPERPLRRWRLIDLGPGPTLATRPLAIDEQVLHELVGVGPGDGPLAGLAHLLPDGELLAPSQQAAADDLAATVGDAGDRVLVRLLAADADTARAAARRVAARLGRSALLVRADGIPAAGSDLIDLATSVARSALLHRAVPVLTADGALAELLDEPVIIVTGDGPGVPGRFLVRRTIAPPDAREQRSQWDRALGLPGGSATPLARTVDELAGHYRFGTAAIAGLAARLRGAAGTATDERTALRLRTMCRDHTRIDLDGLAERVDARAGWDDLVLPDGQLRLLRDIAQQVRYRTLVYDRWGLAAKANRGLGITALFAGESGTGKTMAAEVIAGDLSLDLYRVDLSAVVSKYVGETEKNLRALFDVAETSGAVLLFDEADALFGKRGEVRDSRDRYANLEVAYLLQRMETYRGLAILATNLRSNVDRAFLRRLRFVVQFPFPDEASRARIWARSFPERTPVEGLNPDVLARLQVPGGSIRAIAVGAAFAAAAAGAPVRPEHVLRAARVEYAKAERPLTEIECAGLVRSPR